jgi:hypothetical protein
MKQDQPHLSSNLAIRGPFVDETFRMFQNWDRALSPAENIRQIEATNSVGASSSAWLKQFLKSIKTRYDLSNIDRPLIELVQQGWSVDDWRPILLWHICRKDELLRLFLTDWLFQAFERGIVVMTAETVIDYLRPLVKKTLGRADAWTEITFRRVASGLLRTATTFHLLRGRTTKEFAAYRLPERSFIYLLHSLLEREQNTKKMVEALDWRLYLITPTQVEEELLRLHQYGKLRFERAGSFLELTLPCENRSDFIRSAAL